MSMTFETRLEALGLHRVVAPPGVLPQAASVLDAASPPLPSEIVIDVDLLVLDAASARQLVTEHGAAGVPAAVAAIVRKRGKMHNPNTGSGGIASGTVREIGADYPAGGLVPGASVATLVSLTLTPLHLETVGDFDEKTHQLEVAGTAVLPASAAVASLPDDLPREVALAALDVAGAPSYVSELARSARRIFVLGAGTAGLLSVAAARRAAGGRAKIVVADASPTACARAQRLNLADAVLHVERHLDVRERQRVTERDELARALRRHDSRELRGCKCIAFREIAQTPRRLR